MSYHRNSILQCILLLLFIAGCSINGGKKIQRQIYQIKIYHLSNDEQEEQIDHFLQNAYLPALHRLGIEHVGVFKPIDQDTTSDRRIYVFTPFDSFSRFSSMTSKLADDEQYQKAGEAYLQAPYDQPPYDYFETILLEAFPDAPRVQESNVKGPKSERVYELRSYGSPTEALQKNKVAMFNEGGEIDIFSRLGFNALFYGDVLCGSEMPNLMYMITFEDMESRNKHWEAFRNDAEWEELSSMEKYQNNLSRIDNYFLHPTPYSDL